MNTLDQTVQQHLKTIAASCTRLLNALHHSPEAVWGEIQAIESACRGFHEAYGSTPSPADPTTEILTLIAAVRGQMAKQGLMDPKDFAAFRGNVLAIQQCANTLREALG